MNNLNVYIVEAEKEDWRGIALIIAHTVEEVAEILIEKLSQSPLAEEVPDFMQEVKPGMVYSFERWNYLQAANSIYKTALEEIVNANEYCSGSVAENALQEGKNLEKGAEIL